MGNNTSPESWARGQVQRLLKQNNTRAEGLKWAADQIIEKTVYGYASQIALRDLIPLVQTAIGDNNLGNVFIKPGLDLASQVAARTVKYSTVGSLVARVAKYLVDKFVVANRPAPVTRAGLQIAQGAIDIGLTENANLVDYTATVESIYNQVVTG